MPDSKKGEESGSQSRRKAHGLKAEIEPAIDLSGLTPEQAKYIEKIRQAEDSYDPDFVIGAPQQD